MRRKDPRFARALATGQPCRPREYRHGRAWAVLGLSLLVLTLGLVLRQGLLLASGLVMAGAAGHLFDPQRDRYRQGPRRS
ncbi:DUF3040 domain-containing protein [Streptomyces sp. NPDC005438]|uniref:DUF3040 domain-containing protein n=1 Tax=Streptomyces sp. NPDC005438 TaxID=3156880 RepID=UPI0033AEF61B